MTRLYIIGNGFDLYHGLPTQYGQFYDFAKDVLEEIENYYSLSLSETNPWHDFENALGAFNWKNFYDTHSQIDINTEDFRPSYAYCLEDDLTEQANELVATVKDYFQKWISNIDISTATRKLNLLENSVFITFNYTSTLETIYGIETDKILHIHGRSDTYDDLIFGHGETMNEESELDENGYSNRTIFSDAESAAKYPFYAFRKPVDEGIVKLEQFLAPFEPIREIFVIGHSLNNIDLPYIRSLAKRAPHAKWKVYIYKPGDEENYIRTLILCGISKKRINTGIY